MTELTIIKRLTNKANEKLTTEKLRKELERLGYCKITDLTSIAIWEWELIIEKFERNSKEFTNTLKILEIINEFKKEKTRILKETFLAKKSSIKN